MKVPIRAIAETLGARRIARELDMRWCRWRSSPATEIAPFRWLNDHFLKSTVQEWVILDRDFRSDEEIAQTRGEFQALGIRCHIWKKKELENYLLIPRAIAKRAGVDTDWVERFSKKSLRA